MALARKNRLNKGSDIKRVFEEGKTVRNSFLFIKFLKNEAGYPKAAVIVSKKISARAVIRNKIKRIVFEIFRQTINGKSVDAAISVLPAIVGKSFKEIKKELQRTINGIVVNPERDREGPQRASASYGVNDEK